MKTGKKFQDSLKSEFLSDRNYGALTPGKALKIYRELSGLSQNQLAEMSGLKQGTISSLENNRVTMGIDRARVLAEILGVHPGILAFADWKPAKSVA
jgi:transcriptional regulator with XRE-family HTH domain